MSSFIDFHMRRRTLLVTFALIFTLSASINSRAQTDASKQERPRRALPAENDPQDVIKIDTDLVPVDVTVTDTKGRLVRNLKKEDFKLFEDGVERPIASFNVEKIEGSPRPLAIVFAIDLSGSMTPEEVDRVSDASGRRGRSTNRCRTRHGTEPGSGQRCRARSAAAAA